MNNFTKLLLFLCFFFISNAVSAQISGTVFRDFNGNGVKNNSATFNEPFVQGVTVKATLTNGTSFTTTTSAAGAYSFTAAQIPAASAVRIEFSGLALGDYSSFNGTGNGSNVQFVIAPSSTTNFAINNPSEFSQTNPTLATNSYVEGDAAAAPLKQVLASVPYAASGTTVVHSMEADHLQLGATWGLAYHRKTRTLFASAYQKRHTSYGSGNSTGVIYKVPNPADASTTGVSVFLDLNVLYGTNVAGNNPHPNATANFTTDEASYGLSGKISIGGIDLSEDENFLWVVNLNDRQLYKVPVGLNLEAPTLASQITRYPLYNQCDCDGVGGLDGITDQNLRPFAVKAYGGKVYIGMVCGAYSTPTDFTKLNAYVFSFDPITATFTQVLTFPLTYNRGTGNSAVGWNVSPVPGGYGGTNTANWRPWDDTYSRSELSWYDPAFREGGYPQPMLSDIEFDALGNMHVGLRDRFGDMVGDGVNEPGGSSTLLESDGVGDILRATPSGSNWTLNITQATNGTEFYLNDNFGTGHLETSNGGLAHWLGTTTIVNTAMDPVNNISFGLDFPNSSTGALPQTYQVYRRGSGTAPADDYFAKSNGNGDVELLCDYEPLQIGNRIWFDTNGNGVQDAGETTTVTDGTVVTLRSPGINGIYGDGDDQTWTTTTTSGSYYFSALSSADNRKPASWTGVGNTVLPGFDYRIEVAAPSGYQVTNSNIAANSVDNIDNDAVANGSNAFVTFNTSNTNHNFDIGFKPQASLGDKVWRDDDADGVQDTGEPGVAGITVTLRDNSGNLVASTVTDSYGNYLFDNLTPGNYTVTVTLPANYTFTAQTNTVDNTAGAAPIATGSDVNATTGQSYVINLVAGENERNIDAGLVFSQPTAVSLGDKVWFDNGGGGGTAGNGVQDGAEPGVAGVTVILYASNGTTVLATTITDANGNYRFNNLTAGVQYIVGFTPPAGFIFTGKDLGGNDNTDSDVNTALGATFGKTDLLAALTAGENRTSIDAGLVQQAATAASVGDRVWNDINQNGIQDAGEPGVAGVTVTLYQNGTAIATTVTDAFGNYIFNNLTAGTGYQVGITLPAGYMLSPSDQGTDNKLDNDIQTILSNRTPLFPLTAGLRNLTLDAGIYRTTPAGTARLGDKVWFDANSNGTQDGGNEAGVPGVTVELLNSSGVSIDPDGAGPLTRTLTVTDAAGNYQFVNLAAGSYIVAFSNIPSGYNFTQQVTPGDNGNNTNSDANPLTGRSSVIALAAGESDQTVDAGLVAGTSSGLGSLGNKIWYDLPVTTGGTDGNGIQDAGELGVAGVTVTLLDAGADGIVGNGDDGASRTTITNSLGEYLFTGLPAGNYVVQFGTAALQLPAGFTVTSQNTGANDNIDSDGGAIAAGGAPAGSSRTGVISLTAGEDNLSVDLGLRPAANTNTLGDKVWSDNGAGGGIANDGVQNGTEPGIAGVTVTLYNNTGTAIASTTTDANGQYLFAGLADGIYSVGFTNLPAGFSLTTTDTDGVPGNGTLDSDPDRITGRTVAVTLGAVNRNDRTLDAGIVSTRAALGNFVWYDTNGDGDQDAGEAGVPGVTVSLYFDANNDGDFLDAGENVPASSMITDQSGAYFFPNLLPGNYQVGFTTIPAGVNFTTQDAGGNDALDSDVIPATGRTATVNLSPGEVDLTVDAGLFRPQATVGNFIWVDNGAGGGTSGNGVQDGAEPGLPGIIVTLFDANTNLPISTTVTDGNGGYVFNNVAPGTYYLQIGNLPSGATISPQDAGGNDNTDNDFNPGTSRTANFVVPPTAVNLSFDGGVLTNLSALPVKITDFTAIKKNSTAELNWKVEAETNIGSYIVERSSDGRNFTSIASVTATGFSNYRTTDAQPLKGLNYYRLRVVDLDGSIQYSEVRIIVFGSKGIVTVFPNPSADRINVVLPESWQGKAVTIDIMDQLGRTVIKISRVQAGQVETVDLSKLPGAAYLLRLINSDGEQEVRKIQVSK